MTEKVRTISNPLTIIAIFAALAEINATISIGLVDKELQGVFIWFVILFPILLVLLFFLTLNFNTKVIYAPSDYKNDDGFHKMLMDNVKSDKEINSDKDIIRKTLDELGIKKTEVKKTDFNVSDDVNYLFSIRYTLEKELRRLNDKFSEDDNSRAIVLLTPKLVEKAILTPYQSKAIRNIYTISSHAIHGNENKLTIAEVNFVKNIAPGLIDELKKIE